MGGGYGGAAYEHLKENQVDVFAYKGAEASVRRTVDRQLRYVNKRTEAYWKFREALDPSQPGGSNIALPPDPALIADLTAPKFEVGPRGLAITSKEKLVKDLGRSTDRGDAVVMAWFEGPRHLTHGEIWVKDQVLRRGVKPQVNMGPRHQNSGRPKVVSRRNR